MVILRTEGGISTLDPHSITSDFKTDCFSAQAVTVTFQIPFSAFHSSRILFPYKYMQILGIPRTG